MKTFISILKNIFFVNFLGLYLPGIYIQNYLIGFKFVLVLSLMGYITNKISKYFTIVTYLLYTITFGTFGYVISATLIMLSAYLINGFKIDNFAYALLLSVAISAMYLIVDCFEKIVKYFFINNKK